MASTIILSDNGVSSGSAGLKETGGNDGVLILQTTTSGGTATNAVYIDASQNVGIGTSSPAFKVQLGVSGATTAADGLRVSNGTARADLIATGATYSYSGVGANQTWLNSGASDLNIGSDQAYSLKFISNQSERARIDSSGNLLVGTTTSPAQARMTAKGVAGSTNYRWDYGPAINGQTHFYVLNADNSNSGVFLTFNGTSWSANSDERLKTTLIPFKNAAEKICSIRSGTGRYLTDPEEMSRAFLIAQDVQAVLPEAVDIQEDEIGTLGLRYQDLIPLLVSAIQEQQALITTLTERITALEAK